VCLRHTPLSQQLWTRAGLLSTEHATAFAGMSCGKLSTACWPLNLLNVVTVVLHTYSLHSTGFALQDTRHRSFCRDELRQIVNCMLASQSIECGNSCIAYIQLAQYRFRISAQCCSPPAPYDLPCGCLAGRVHATCGLVKQHHCSSISSITGMSVQAKGCDSLH
jgi:hypothetical protein